MDLAIDPKNSITGVRLLTFEFLFFSEGCKLSHPLGQRADEIANKAQMLTHGMKPRRVYRPNRVCRAVLGELLLYHHQGIKASRDKQ